MGVYINPGSSGFAEIIPEKPLNLQEKLEAFYQKPLDEIFVESIEEISVGEPAGNEL